MNSNHDLPYPLLTSSHQRELVYRQLNLALSIVKEALLEVCYYFLSKTKSPLFLPEAMMDIHWLSLKMIRASYPAGLNDQQLSSLSDLSGSAQYLSRQAQLGFYLLENSDSSETIDIGNELIIRARSHAFELRRFLHGLMAFNQVQEAAL